MNSPRHVLLAGGHGFIGSAVARALEHESIPFTKVDRRSGIDLCDEAQARSAGIHLGGLDAIIHVAGPASAPLSWETPELFYRTSLLITLNLLELARSRQARLILASSYVYGMPRYLPIDEAHPANPTNPYMASRLMAEQICAAYSRDFRVPIAALRIFNPYGRGQSKAFLVPTVIEGIRKGDLVLRDPAPRRDFVHVDDVAKALVAASRFAFSGLETFNVGTGRGTSVRELVSMALHLSGKAANVRYTSESRRGEIPDVVADISKAGRLLGWTPRVTLEEGIRQLLIDEGGSP